MNWKAAVAKLNSKHFAFPAGWDTRDTIAAQLECSPDRVDTLLGPGLKSGEIEKQQFPVWDSRLGRKVLVWGYRQKSASAPQAKAPDGIAEIVKLAAKKHPGFTPSRLRDYLPKAIRRSVSKEQVAAILGS
jgi:hypothetical protein